MDWLNYHHLFYFWAVAKEGGLVPAARLLRVTHPTLSAQIHALEDSLGEKLFEKSGRKLVLTEHGRMVFRYADEIFALGREMVDTVRGRSNGKPLRLRVGVVDAVPKLVVRRILAPALETGVRLVCAEDTFETILNELGRHALDVVVSDAPVPPGSSVRAFNHLLGESGVSFFGTPSLAARYAPGFPRSLDGAPMLLPLESTTLRRSLNLYFERLGITPVVIGEFEDSALLKVFGSDGAGLFPASTLMAEAISDQYHVRRLGDAVEVRERFYLITAERRLKHPAVIALSDTARSDLFGHPTPTKTKTKTRSRSR